MYNNNNNQYRKNIIVIHNSHVNNYFRTKSEGFYDRHAVAYISYVYYNII